MKTIENQESWSHQRVERLKALWANGLSCSAIAREIGGITRNAVIGKVCRLGLPHRKFSDNSHKRPYPKRKITSLKSEPKPYLRSDLVVSRETVVTPPEKRVPLEALDDTKCKYAHGDAPPYMFCGEKAVMGLRWCEAHARAVFVTPQPSHAEGTGGFQPAQEAKELEAVL